MRLTALTAIGALALAACATTPAPTANVIGTGRLVTATGEARGTINLTRTTTGNGTEVRLLVEVFGMAPGTYGSHVHSVGLCEGPAFTSAGPHWNPAARQHGRLNPAGSHHGDLPNIVVGADGRGRIDSVIPDMVEGRNSLFDVDGSALVVHARPDDERTDPTGNSGDRIACAVLTAG